jgi:hypothetical protein
MPEPSDEIKHKLPVNVIGNAYGLSFNQAMI